MIWLKIGIVVALVAAASYAVYAYNSAIAAAVESEERAKKFAEERDGWIDVAAREASAKQVAEEVSTKRERERRRAQEERDATKRELSALRASSPDVARWLDQPIPAGILERLRRDPNVEAATATGGDRVPGAPAGADKTPGVRRVQ